MSFVTSEATPVTFFDLPDFTRSVLYWVYLKTYTNIHVLTSLANISAIFHKSTKINAAVIPSDGL